MLAKFILWLSTLLVGGYGVACFLDASLAANNAGLELTNADARIEMVSMYGGVQIAVGVFCAMGALKIGYQHAALVLLCLLFGCLSVGRLYGLATEAEPASIYTYAALGYELFSVAIALLALRQNSTAAAKA